MDADALAAVFGDHVSAVYRLAAEAQVDCALHYEDGPRTWYFAINSSAPAEQFVGKSRSDLSDASLDAEVFLRSLRP